MKKFINIFIIVSFSMAGCYTTGQVPQGDNYGYSDNYSNAPVSYETFYDQLQPYGNWVNYPEYGNVWQPNIQQGFRPYETGGHWVPTVDGWAWASDYNWGWAPFHYGRWFFDQSIGWAWVPGYDWAPAWVTWGQYNDYYAWAPLAPGINISFGNSWRAPGTYWSFVPRNCIGYSNLNRYASYGNYNTNVNNITIINNYNSYNQKEYYHRGPNYQEVEQFTHKPINPVAIASASKPGLSRVVNRQLQIYRPGISANGSNNNGSIRNIKSPNDTRNYQGTIRGNGQTETSINGNTGRNWKNPNLNNLPAGSRIDGVTNGTINGGTRVTQESIDNTNRQLQQQQMENSRIMRSPTLSNNPPPVHETPAAPQQMPQNNQPIQQNDVRRLDIRNNFPGNVQPSRPQSRMQDERIMQRPAFPEQNERLMRQPQAPAMPQRMESRDANAGRSMQMERRGNGMQRPSRF